MAPVKEAVEEVVKKTPWTKVGAEFGKFGKDFKGVGTGIRDSAAGIISAVQNGSGTAGNLINNAAASTAKWTVRAARLPVKAASAVYNTRFVGPIALLATAFFGAKAVGGWLHRRAEQRTQREALTQMVQAPAPMPIYASPEEVAAMEARFRQGGQNGGFAAGIQAERAAAAAPQQSTVA